MRHNKKFNHLGRTNTHRQAMLANMASSLIQHKRIFTTTAKAKALRKYIEPIITKSKEDTTHSRRIVFSYLQNKHAVTELFQEVSQKIADRPGGYTRILKTGHRLGDNAAMCFIELVDYNENMLKDTKKKAAKTTRRSRKKATTDAPATEAVVVEEAPKAKKAPKAAAPVEEEAPKVEAASEVEAPAAEEAPENKEEKAAE
ncbi:large subunit ribosomal protein L17 [Parabacteroides sp. PF5-5]|uniref:50S ribosomal protein L17 n=1 Tax=unclassified Parabacteroides TaxID=2649774 RepID=UPI0024733E57|nr:MULTISPECIES: 50S ribosomal protein L17 [unclassified Parabacteroides]MDH6306182.1 large subunit ribosomal protein L17 [Parabacteroides sp. PH5-39]MDH6317141.1 large subunit ribosomal protein L17 [Parabacteroides sp. PF5-13]MDH6320894.1 large subunit ribosomal protein L17 [Parabacteroides sp. PH5-13]MDH6324625.1 large subunit ribosomal protein L17 [Parabacteroides sp. PH5-8]MDH6328324.1 large subunit ribosomal protein L17 [Parabacteroides sp. PH5-41]